MFKYYGVRGGSHLGTPQQRQERELRVLRVLGERSYIPQIVATDHDPRITVFKRLQRAIWDGPTPALFHNDGSLA